MSSDLGPSSRSSAAGAPLPEGWEGRALVSTITAGVIVLGAVSCSAAFVLHTFRTDPEPTVAFSPVIHVPPAAPSAGSGRREQAGPLIGVSVPNGMGPIVTSAPVLRLAPVGHGDSSSRPPAPMSAGLLPVRSPASPTAVVAATAPTAPAAGGPPTPESGPARTEAPLPAPDATLGPVVPSEASAPEFLLTVETSPDHPRPGADKTSVGSGRGAVALVRGPATAGSISPGARRGPFGHPSAVAATATASGPGEGPATMIRRGPAPMAAGSPRRPVPGPPPAAPAARPAWRTPPHPGPGGSAGPRSGLAPSDNPPAPGGQSARH